MVGEAVLWPAELGGIDVGTVTPPDEQPSPSYLESVDLSHRLDGQGTAPSGADTPKASPPGASTPKASPRKRIRAKSPVLGVTEAPPLPPAVAKPFQVVLQPAAGPSTTVLESPSPHPGQIDIPGIDENDDDDLPLAALSPAHPTEISARLLKHIGNTVPDHSRYLGEVVWDGVGCRGVVEEGRGGAWQ